MVCLYAFSIYLVLVFFCTLLDVLTPLSDSRQESVEKMERKNSELSYMCWMDFYNAILCCRFLCARLISVYSVYFVSLLCLLSFPATTARATTLHLYARAITPLPPLHGYHACLLPGYHDILLFSIPGLSHLSLSLIHI